MSVGIRGRRPKLVRVDGEIMELHKPMRSGNSVSVFLPRAWIMAVESQDEVVGFAVSYNAKVLTIRPYYGEGGNDDKH